jgi:charged multivesicular body protein 5
MLEDVGEISEILGRSYGMPDGIEEEDLDAELACLEDEWADDEVELDAGTSVGAETSLPANPTGTVFAQAEATAETAEAESASASAI